MCVHYSYTISVFPGERCILKVQKIKYHSIPFFWECITGHWNLSSYKAFLLFFPHDMIKQCQGFCLFDNTPLLSNAILAVLGSCCRAEALFMGDGVSHVSECFLRWWWHTKRSPWPSASTGYPTEAISSHCSGLHGSVRMESIKRWMENRPKASMRICSYW